MLAVESSGLRVLTTNSIVLHQQLRLESTDKYSEES